MNANWQESRHSSLGITGCRSCSIVVTYGARYCAPCADWADGYASGAHYCDDFSGTTPESAAKYAAQVELPADLQHPARYAEGLLAGLCAAAKENEQWG